MAVKLTVPYWSSCPSACVGRLPRWRPMPMRQADQRTHYRVASPKTGLQSLLGWWMAAFLGSTANLILPFHLPRLIPDVGAIRRCIGGGRRQYTSVSWQLLHHCPGYPHRAGVRR